MKNKNWDKRRATKDDVVGWIMACKHVQALILGTCECYFIWQIETLQLLLPQGSWGGEDYPELLGWDLNGIICVLLRGRFERKRKKPCDQSSRKLSRGWGNVICCCWRWWVDRKLLGTGKGMETTPPLEPLLTPWLWLSDIHFGLWTSGTIRKLIGVIFSYCVCGNFTHRNQYRWLSGLHFEQPGKYDIIY